MHHAKKAKRWLPNRAVNAIRKFFLPTYSPELNPDEYLNCDLKSMLHSGEAIRSVNDLKKRTRSCVRALQKKPERVKSYLNATYMRYAA
ncbi:transposase [Candidatus Vondammii sp. HM_W22]|uniref:transposase n=1 Tax=Candidatus Vondammii sp. HM_W22 TaxID=2687299 RepID=UPI001F146D3F|nr:transposase [Candidatus Vondammii sp. HM_W22]